MFQLENLSYSYPKGPAVLQGVDAVFERGQLTAIVGESGAGKSTLLNLLTGFNQDYTGSIAYNQHSLRQTNLDHYRQQQIGLVFQDFNLLNHSSGLYNLTLAMAISAAGTKNTLPKGHRKQTAYDLLAKLGIDREHADRPVSQLSGGQRQRVGIARALCKDPQTIIADEPTGNLDEQTEGEILGILQQLAHESGKCVVIVTHSEQVMARADVVYTLANAQLMR